MRNERALNTPDRHGRRRWWFSFFLAIAINALAIGLFRSFPEPPRDAHAATTIVTIEQRSPTPRPTATPTPPAVVRVPPHATPAPRPQVAAPRLAGPREPRHGGSPARHLKPVPSVYAELTHSDLGHAAGVAGTGTGSGAGAAPDGGGDAGTGTSAGTGGNGTGNVNANTPCGAVSFYSHDAPRVDHGTMYERVTASVSFPDGHHESAVFPYEWVYPNGEQTDPWSGTNLRLHPNDFPIPAQTPAPGTDLSDYPPLIQYILTHTNPNGNTRLAPCPAQTAPAQ
jgi:hypothetical protein